MTTSADLTNFWEHFSQTALNKDIGVMSAKRPGPTDCSSFLAVPTKNNFTPTPPTKKTHVQKPILFTPPSSFSKFVTSLGPNKLFTTVNGAPPSHEFAAPVLDEPVASPSPLFSSSSATLVYRNNIPASGPTQAIPQQLRKAPSAVTYLNFRDLMVPHILQGILQNQNTTNLDLNSVYLRWPEILPPDSHWYMISQLRIHAGAPERSELGIKKLINYFEILEWLEEKIPFETERFPDFPFSWFEAFSPNKIVSSGCIQYEKAAVLFNLGAVYSQLAASQQIWTPGGIRTASVYFQRAAGVFAHIRDSLAIRLRIKLDSASDISQGTLNALSEIMLAQAHECFVEKANIDAASSSLTSQISAQTAEHYELALQVAKADDGSSSPPTPGIASIFQRTLTTRIKSSTRFPSDWLPTIQSKVLLYTAFSHFHAPGTLGPEVAIGERISRLIISKTLAEQAVDEGKNANEMTVRVLKYYLAQISGALHVAEVTNVQKYQVTIVDPRHLSPLRRMTQSCVSGTPFVKPGLSEASKGLALEHSAFSSGPAIRSAWRRCVVLLTDILALSSEAQDAVDSLDGIISKFQAALLVRPMSRHDPDQSIVSSADSMDETTLVALLHRLNNLATDESILSVRTMLSSLLSALQRSRLGINMIRTNLDRAGHLERSPIVYTQANTIQSKLTSATIEVNSLQDIYDESSSLFKPNGTLFKFQPEDWTRSRIIQLYTKSSQPVHGKGFSDTFTESLLALTKVRDELSLFLSDVSELSLNMSEDCVLPEIVKCQLLLDENSKKVRSYVPEITSQSKSILAESCASHQVLVTPEDAWTVLNGLVNNVELMSKARCTLENHIEQCLTVQEVIESLVQDSTKIAYIAAEEESHARATASAPNMLDLERVNNGNNSLVDHADQARRDWLLKLQQKLNHQTQLKPAPEPAKQMPPGPIPASPRCLFIIPDRNAYSDQEDVSTCVLNHEGNAQERQDTKAHTTGQCNKSHSGNPSRTHTIEDNELVRARHVAEDILARTSLVDEWAAGQVDWAKHRKKLWNHGAGPKPRTSDVKKNTPNSKPRTDGSPRRQTKNPQHPSSPVPENNKKSDSGTIMPHDSITGAMDLSETVSQMKLRTDVLLSHISIATQPTSAAKSRRSEGGSHR